VGSPTCSLTLAQRKLPFPCSFFSPLSQQRLCHSASTAPLSFTTSGPCHCLSGSYSRFLLYQICAKTSNWSPLRRFATQDTSPRHLYSTSLCPIRLPFSELILHSCLYQVSSYPFNASVSKTSCDRIVLLLVGLTTPPFTGIGTYTLAGILHVGVLSLTRTSSVPYPSN
jgi:hypothetical protein